VQPRFSTLPVGSAGQAPSLAATSGGWRQNTRRTKSAPSRDPIRPPSVRCLVGAARLPERPTIEHCGATWGVPFRPGRHQLPAAGVQPSCASSSCPFAPRGRLTSPQDMVPEGSPLVVHSRRLAAALHERLGPGFRVALGMRYGEPRLERAVQGLAADGVRGLIVAPLFPQFSFSTTGSIQSAVDRALASSQGPSLERRFVEPFFDAPAYIDAVAAGLRLHLASMPLPPEHVLVSFHGLPALPPARRPVSDAMPDHCPAACRSHGVAAATVVAQLPVSLRTGGWLAPSTQARIRSWHVRASGAWSW
jgi:hypothetical protein